MVAIEREAARPPAARGKPDESLQLFGGAVVLKLGSGIDVPLAWERSTALLAYLALNEGWHPRERLATILRSDANAAAARSYLRGLLHKLRQDLPPTQSLMVEDHRVCWAGGSDVKAFEQAVARSDWERAVALQAKPLLDRLDTRHAPELNERLAEDGRRLSGQLRHALMALILQRHAAGADAQDLMQRLLEIDSLDEDALQFVLGQSRSVLECHFASAAFQAFQRQLAAEIEEKPLPLTFSLHEQLQARTLRKTELPSDLPSGSDTRLHEPPGEALLAPHEEIPFGRAGDFQKLAHLIQRPAVRLITISGFGGVGKSVLARSLFHWVAREGDMPCVWVDLAGASSLEAMLESIGSGVGIREPCRSTQEELMLRLSERRVLLFLDNIEQLSVHAPVLGRLLERAPLVRIVATSRDVLKLTEEYVVPIGGLDYEGPRSAAARLFALHAERGGYRLDPSHDAHVVALVAHLRGLPPAIELAATWLPVLGPEAVLQEICGNPSFLDSASAQAGGPHTMQFILTSTWKQLHPDEQRTLAALAAFSDAIPLETALRVPGAQPAVLLSLVQKSVLQRAGSARFQLHPLLRGFVLANASSDHVASAGRMLGRSRQDSVGSGNEF